MKKITTLMVMLVCCICSALAQTVASTPTAPQDIQDGYYMLLVKSADGKTDDNGNFAHANSYDAKGSANDFVGKTLDDPSNYNYVYYITNNNGKLRIKSAFTKKWWESVSASNYRPTHIPVGESATEFTYQLNDSWAYLKTQTYYKKYLWSDPVTKDVFVTLNNKNQIGYWDDSNPTGNTAQFQFYAVDIKLPMTVSTVAAPVLYYFVGGVDNPMKISHATSTSTMMRAESEDAASINDIAKDLWFVEGDFDNGFRFYNYNAQAHLMRYSTDVLSSQTMTLRKGDALSGGIDKWAILPLADNKFAVSGFGTDFSTVWYTADPWVKLGAFGNSAKFSVEAPTFTYTMYNGYDGHNYNTFSAPFDVKLASSENDVKMYKGVADYDAKEFKMEEITAAPAEAGIFLMGNNAKETVTLEVTAGVADLQGNELIGSTTDVEGLEDKLILGPSTTTNEIGFFAAADGVTTLYANHAYLMRKTLSTVEGLSLSFGGKPTGIGQVSTSDVKNAPIYDLTGRRVNHTVKGQLYIQGGRKFIAR